MLMILSMALSTLVSVLNETAVYLLLKRDLSCTAT